MGIHPELVAEQAFVDRAYERLRVLEAKAVELATSERKLPPGGTFAARLERDVRERAGMRRRADLRVGSLNLCFGRIDNEDGSIFHLGRVAIDDEDQEPLIVDWRAPIAEPFYRATPADPLGLRRRRHLLTRGREVLRLDDEVFGESALGASDAGDLVLVGEAALLDALRRARTGRMGDIVATIQAEQDRIIRSPLGGTVVVQGGPGTGKTAVALHRAAYLLYTHRFPLEQLGVLFVGPNPIFLRYIERVLPTLGESGCRMTMVDELVEGASPTIIDPPAVTRLKGDSRMVEFIARGVRSRQRPLRKAVLIPFGAYSLRLGPKVSEAIVKQVRALPGTHNARRPTVERLVLGHLSSEYSKAVARAEAAGLPARALPTAEVNDDLASSRDVRRLLNRLWPRLSATRFLDDLLGTPALLAEAGAGLLDGDEQQLLFRPRTTDGDTPIWSGADIALLDEAAPLLGPERSAPRANTARREMAEDPSVIIDRAIVEHLPECPTCRFELTYRGDAGREWWCEPCDEGYASRQVLSPEAALLIDDLRRHVSAQVVQPDARAPEALRTYGHVVVDEAQDLSPMQWRVLARRCPSGSMTVVGDLGQASGHWTYQSWDEVVELLPATRTTVVELTVNYRTPHEVMDLAARVLAEARPDLTPARSVRDAGVDPRFIELRDADLVGGAIAAAAGEVAALEDGGKVAVIAPESLLEATRDALAARPELADEAADVLEAPVSVLTVDDAKGLEFDSVVVVDPAEIANEHAQGLGALYVALTRTTTRLVVVHAGDLPSALNGTPIG